MSRIRILPEILSNKIAAGEVVERPASVVKELVENALDAGSTRVIVEVEKGGRSLIRVSDNGSGMGRDDALLAVERHATSKIRTEEDLFAIGSLGFRGEALPSIASVSRFSLVTREQDSDTGTEVLVEGGRIEKVSDAGAPPGTMVTVKDLFFNVPARRKFLKAVGTEMGHIAEAMSGFALGWPQIHLRLIHNGKVVKDFPASANPLDRVVEVLGTSLKPELLPVREEEGAVRISGWIGSVRIFRNNSQGVYLFVNGRLVRDRMIQHALLQGYSERLVKGQYPVAVLSVSVPPDQVDVNVHPAKNEVRFADAHGIHQVVARGVRKTLGAAERLHGVNPENLLPEAGRVAEGVSSGSVFGWQSTGLGPEAGQVTPWRPEPRMLRDVTESQGALWEKKAFGDLRIIGQLHRTYILCEAVDGFILVDQHAAHERILYEELKKRSMEGNPAVQRLLIPEPIELGFREAGLLEAWIPDLRRTGFEIEPFGDNTFVIKAVPGLLAESAPTVLIREIVEKSVDGEAVAGTALERCLMLAACHGSIRAGQSLTEAQMKGLLSQLDACHNPGNCPHGRPTWIRWTLRELEKAFHRVQ
jgi:DNA mismatch repair protein MutL